MRDDDSDLAWDTLDSETEYSCPGFDIVRDDVAFPDGERGSFHYITEPPSVVVLRFTAGGEFVVGTLPAPAGGEFVVGTLPAPADDDDESRLPELEGGRLVAAGGFRPTDAGYEDERAAENAAELHRMRVAPTHQGRGNGRALLSELERRALAAGFRLLLATTAVRQRSAVEFYPAAGYREVGRSTYGDYDLVHFEKEI